MLLQTSSETVATVSAEVETSSETVRTVGGAPRNQGRDGVVHPLAGLDLFGDGRDRPEQVSTYPEMVGTIGFVK